MKIARKKSVKALNDTKKKSEETVVFIKLSLFCILIH